MIPDHVTEKVGRSTPGSIRLVLGEPRVTLFP